MEDMQDKHNIYIAQLHHIISTLYMDLKYAEFIVSFCPPAKWSRTVLECSKIILEFSRTMF